MQEGPELGAGSEVAEHPFGLLRHLLARLQRAGPRGFEQGFVGQRIPEAEGEAGGDVVGVEVAVEVVVEEPGRLEHEHHDPLDGQLGVVDRFELVIDVEPLLLLVERTAEGPFGESGAEVAELRLAIIGLIRHARKLAEVLDDVAADLDGGLGRGLVPGLGDRRPPLVADAPVVGREGGLDHAELR